MSRIPLQQDFTREGRAVVLKLGYIASLQWGTGRNPCPHFPQPLPIMPIMYSTGWRSQPKTIRVPRTQK